MAKTKYKKGNRKLKKSVRMAFGAVCMLTAIIIALVPVPDIKADSSAYAYPVSTNAIAAIADESISTSPYNLNLGYKDLASYTIRQLGGVYQYDKQFDYYESTDTTGTKAIISGYNSTYNADSVTVPAYIATGYKVVTEDEYNTWVSSLSGNGIEYTLSSPTDSTVWFFKKYDSSRYTQYLKDYAAYEANPTTVAQPSDLVMTADNSTLSATQLLTYYCDIKLKPTGAVDYTMTKVLNGADNKWIYIPKGGTSTPDMNDSQGFLMDSNIIPVIAIGKGAFKDTHNVKTLVIDDVIKYIGDEAFMNTWVNTVDFGNTSSIGNRAFKNCNQLTSVTFSSAMTKIGAEAFYGTYLTSVTFPSSVQVIGEGAFANCTRLNSVDLSKVTIADSEIKRYAFYNDYAINTLSMDGSSISAIGDAAFAASSGITGTLKEFTFPSNISETGDLGDYTLAGRTNLTSVTMPANF